ncbi:MAG: hypothetical protein J6R59_01275 [Paludibacteraceae bacterium]|nr:hypothetical protein [Paludibacteraceae bacterium]
MFVNENNIFIPGGNIIYSRTDDDTPNNPENKRPHFVPEYKGYTTRQSGNDIIVTPQMEIKNVNGVCNGFVPSAEAQQHICDNYHSFTVSNSTSEDEIQLSAQEKINNYATSNHLNTIEIRAAWLHDMKNKRRSTVIAFRHNSYTSSHYTRLFFYNLDKKYNKLGKNGEYGQPGSYSKKYMVTGLKVTFNALGATELPAINRANLGKHYFTFTTNTWITDQIPHNPSDLNINNLINWDRIPTPYNGPAYQGSFTYNDNFEYADNWDVAPTEQSFDSLLFNFIELRDVTKPHIANKDIHFMDFEKEMLFKPIYTPEFESDLGGDELSDTSTSGFVLEPSRTFTAERVEISDVTNLPSCCLYIWVLNENGEIVTYSQNTQKSEVIGGFHAWLLDSPITFEQGKTYFFTWHGAAPNSGAVAPPNRPETGYRTGPYSTRIKKYQNPTNDGETVSKVYSLKDIQYFTTESINKNETISCVFSNHTESELLIDVPDFSITEGKLIDVENSTVSVKTSDSIIDDADVTVDSKVLFDTLVNKEDYTKTTIEVRDEIEEIGDYSYNSITDASSSNSGNYVGICYRP